MPLQDDSLHSEVPTGRGAITEVRRRQRMSRTQAPDRVRTDGGGEHIPTAGGLPPQHYRELLVDPGGGLRALELLRFDINLSTAVQVLHEHLLGGGVTVTDGKSIITLSTPDYRRADETFAPFIGDALRCILGWGILVYGLRQNVSYGADGAPIQNPDLEHGTSVHWAPYVPAEGSYLISVQLIGSMRVYRVYEFIPNASKDTVPSKLHLPVRLEASAARYIPKGAAITGRGIWARNTALHVIDRFDTAPNPLTGAIRSRMSSVVKRITQLGDQLELEKTTRKELAFPPLLIEQTPDFAKALEEEMRQQGVISMADVLTDPTGDIFSEGGGGGGGEEPLRALQVHDREQMSAQRTLLLSDRVRESAKLMGMCVKAAILQQEKIASWVASGGERRARAAEYLGPHANRWLSLPIGMKVVTPPKPEIDSDLERQERVTHEEISSAIGVPRGLYRPEMQGSAHTLKAHTDAMRRRFLRSLQSWSRKMNDTLIPVFRDMRARTRMSIQLQDSARGSQPVQVIPLLLDVEGGKKGKARAVRRSADGMAHELRIEYSTTALTTWDQALGLYALNMIPYDHLSRVLLERSGLTTALAGSGPPPDLTQVEKLQVAGLIRGAGSSRGNQPGGREDDGKGRQPDDKLESKTEQPQAKDSGEK